MLRFSYFPSLFSFLSGDKMSPEPYHDVEGYIERSSFANIYCPLPKLNIISNNTAEVMNYISLNLGARNVEAIELAESLLAWASGQRAQARKRYEEWQASKCFRQKDDNICATGFAHLTEFAR